MTQLQPSQINNSYPNSSFIPDKSLDLSRNLSRDIDATLYAPRPLNDFQKSLLVQIKQMVEKERSCTLAVLQLLRKIESEKIFAIMGYPSLWEFVMKELGYSHDATFRRP